MRQIILASQSPRRRDLLKALIGNNFITRPSEYEEDNSLKIPPVELAMKHALGKAKDVAKHYDSGIVIGGDVFVVFNNEVLGKPKDKEEAFRMLKKQSGKKTKVIAGLAVIDIDNNKEYVEYEITDLIMTKLSDKELKGYVNIMNPLDKAGSFAMKPDDGAILVEKVEGCYSNVVGMPLQKLHKIFRKIGIEIFNY